MSDKFKYTTGLNNVGSYQVAGSPYVTASTVSQDTEQEIQFPRVTNNVTVKLDSAAGQTFNSIEMTGTFNFSSSVGPFTDQSEIADYSISAWVSASKPTDQSDNINLFGFGSNTRNTIREKSGQWQFIVQSRTAVVNRYFGIIPDGWHFIVGVAFGANGNAPGDLTVEAYLNGSQVGATATTNDAISGMPHIDSGGATRAFTIGANSNPFSERFKFRDLILWDGKLTSAQVSTLYNGGNYYDASAFTAVEKKMWVKDTLEANSDGDTVPENLTGSLFFKENNFGGSDAVTVVSDSPFASGGSGGGLRIHYRSTGSLPNVANNKHYWTLSSQDEEIKMNVKTKEIYLSAVNGDCDFSLHADMTNIPAARMYQHTGSGVDE